MPDKMLSVEDVADELGVNPETVRVWIRSGELVALSIGKGYRILVFIEITILAIEAPLPEMHKSMPRMGADFALATDSVAILRLRRNFAPLIIFIH